MPNKNKPILILGGGIGGVTAAIELAKAGKKVTLIEREDELLIGSSNKTPGRAGGGFHYADKETALDYLRLSVNFAKKYGQEIPEEELFVGGKYLSKNPKHRLGRGRYLIINNSDTPKEKILETYEALKNEYTRLVQENSVNKVFGEPEDFFTYLEESDYEDHVDKTKIQVAVETAERLMNWPRVRQHLLDEVNKYRDLIEVKMGFELSDIKKNTDGEFIAASSCGEKVEGSGVVNSLWAFSQEFNYKVGYATNTIEKNTERSNRIKTIIKGKLPKKLVDKKLQSNFFCMSLREGAMVSVMDDEETFYATFSGVTNIMHEKEVIPSGDLRNYLNTNPKNNPDFWDRVNPQKYGRQILQGIAQYIPGIEEAKVESVGFGNVLTHGQVKYDDPKSDVHFRRYDGVNFEFPMGWVENCPKKLVEALPNALKITEYFNSLQSHGDNFNQWLEENAKPSFKKSTDFNALCRYLSDHLTFKELSVAVGEGSGDKSNHLSLILKVINAKKELIREINDVNRVAPIIRKNSELGEKPVFNPTDEVDMNDLPIESGADLTAIVSSRNETFTEINKLSQEEKSNELVIRNHDKAEDNQQSMLVKIFLFVNIIEKLAANPWICALFLLLVANQYYPLFKTPAIVGKVSTPIAGALISLGMMPSPQNEEKRLETDEARTSMSGLFGK